MRSCAARTGPAGRGTWRRTRPGRRRAPTSAPVRARPRRPAARAQRRRIRADEQTPATSSEPNARCSRAVWRSIIAIARAWPVAPSSADRMTWASNGSDRTPASPSAAAAGTRRSARARCTRRGPARRSRSAPQSPADRRDSVRCPARVSSLMSRHSLPWRIAATSRPIGTDSQSAVDAPGAADREVGADDHQRAHQQEHERHAERVELVLRTAAPCRSSRRRARSARGRRSPGRAGRSARRRRATARPKATNAADERLTLGQPALEERVAGPRRRDRVDALPDVVDLVDDVRAGVEQHAAEQRQRGTATRSKRPSTHASAPPARTGITEAV